MLKDRDYYLVERDGTISALRKPAAGGLEVELAVPPAGDKAVMDEPKQRVDLVLDRTKPDTLPVDLLVVAGIKSADETSPHVPHPGGLVLDNGRLEPPPAGTNFFCGTRPWGGRGAAHGPSEPSLGA